MKDRYVLVIDSHEEGHELYRMLFEELYGETFAKDSVHIAGSYQEACRKFLELSERIGEGKLVVIADAVAHGTRENRCTSGLLKEIRALGHNIVLYSRKPEKDFSPGIRRLVDSGVPFVLKSVAHFSDSKNFYSQVISPALSAV